MALTGAVAWTFSNQGASSLPRAWDGKSFQFVTAGSALRIRNSEYGRVTTDYRDNGNGSRR